MPQQITDKPVRAELYDTVVQAERAVQNLIAAGFTKEEIGVVCSEKHKERFFPEVSTLAQSGTPLPRAGPSARPSAGRPLPSLRC
jgi:hypothetical protein